MQGGSEQEFDGFGVLMGEMPSASYGCRQESGPNLYHASQAENYGTSATNVNCLLFDRPSVRLSKGPFNHKILTGGRNLDGELTPMKNNHQSEIVNVNSEDLILPSDHCLTSAFSQLSFKDGVEISPQLVNCNSSPKNTFLPEGQCPKQLYNSFSSLDPGGIGTPYTRSRNGRNAVMMNPILDSPDGFSVNLIGRESGMFDYLDAHDLNTCENLSGENAHVVPIYPGTMSTTSCNHSFQVVPSVPPGVEFSVPQYQEQYFFDAQAHIPYMLQKQLHVEEDRHYRMQQQYLYWQQLQNPGLETLHQNHTNIGMTIGPINSNVRPYLEIPISNHLEQASGDFFWNSASIPKEFDPSELTPTRNDLCWYYAQGLCGRGDNCPFVHEKKQNNFFNSSSLSGRDFEVVHLLNKAGKHNFPKKILTRPHGLDSLKAINPSSFSREESYNHVNSKGEFLSNDHFYLQQSFLNSGKISRGFSFEIDTSRSQMLKYNSVDEAVGNIYALAKDQNGCRFLQKKSTEGNLEDINKIFNEIIGHIVELMTDPFGNYLVQKLVEVCDENQRTEILHAVTRTPWDLLIISKDMHGTRVVQKVIETLNAPEQFSMVVSSLEPGVVNLIKDVNGSHVAQRCLQCFKPAHAKFIYEAAINNCVELAIDRYGCVVLQRCLILADVEQRRLLVSEVIVNALNLSQDQYGNYVVQCVLELELPWAIVDMLNQLKGNYVYLSIQKYSSNVVEKCLKFSGEDCRSQIVHELLSDLQLDQILQDRYGNYVIQAALQHSKGAAHAALVKAIRLNVPVLETSPYGKKILSHNSLKD